jgi:tripartite-type tricarboxylate transporter receptor subunit TctC
MTTTGKLRLVSATAALALGMIVSAAQAQYPDRPINMLVSAGAGGSTDAGARILAQSMEKTLGQPVVVVNKPGGAGSTALIQLKDMPADGYTIGYVYSHHVSFASRYKRKKIPYTAKDFSYIGSITEARFSVVSLAGRGWSNVREMVAKLKADGKPLRFVYSGGPGRLVATAIGKDLGIKLQIVRARSGGESMQKILGGHVDAMFSGGAHTRYTQAGKTIVAGAINEKRDPDYPDAPTLMEMGVHAATPGLQIVVGPKGMPDSAVANLAAAMMAARKDEKIATLFRKNMKMLVDDKGPKDLAAYMLKEEEGYRQLIASYDK